MRRFSFCSRSQVYVLLVLEPREKRKVSQRNSFRLLKIRVLKIFSLIVEERNTVNTTSNLSTWRHLTNQRITPESGNMERRHKKGMSPGSAALSACPDHHWARFARRQRCFAYFCFVPFSPRAELRWIKESVLVTCGVLWLDLIFSSIFPYFNLRPLCLRPEPLWTLNTPFF